jgi:hypothetical protein
LNEIFGENFIEKLSKGVKYQYYLGKSNQNKIEELKLRVKTQLKDDD